MTTRSRRLLGMSLLLLSSTAMTSCDWMGAGPCAHSFEDPLITIANVRSAEGEPLDRVFLGELALNGAPVSAAVLASSSTSHDVEPGAQGGLICDVSCGFAAEEGTYSFTISAEGYESKEVSLDARYESFSGGCPSSNSGGTTVSEELIPVQ